MEWGQHKKQKLDPFFFGKIRPESVGKSKQDHDPIEGDGADRAAVIRLIQQGFARVGLEADQPDCDRVSSDQGFQIGQSGCDQSDDDSDQGQLGSCKESNIWCLSIAETNRNP